MSMSINKTKALRALVLLGAAAVLISACGGSADADGDLAQGVIVDYAPAATSLCGLVEASCGNAGLYRLVESSVSKAPPAASFYYADIGGDPLTHYIFESLDHPAERFVYTEHCGSLKNPGRHVNCRFDFNQAETWFLVHRSGDTSGLLSAFGQAPGRVIEAQGIGCGFETLAELQEAWNQKLERMPPNAACGAHEVYQDAAWCGEPSPLYH